ncbi:MAG TPA: hypothetical protein VMG34_04415 [Bacteroidota bacterium]|nr:hypothetical protein [Bacteroidota bacterium]
MKHYLPREILSAQREVGRASRPRPSSTDHRAILHAAHADEPKRSTGKLKVFVTRIPLPNLFEGMVAEGRRLLASGVDVVVALEDEHREIDFPSVRIIPPKVVTCGKKEYYELDEEAILRRSPALLIVDNFLHVKISASGREMRYQDIRDMLDAGISVVTSAYSAFGSNLKNALEYVSAHFPAPFSRNTDLPKDEVLSLVFAAADPFEHLIPFFSTIHEQ